MRKIEISSCMDCPFRSTVYDDIALDFPFIETCSICNYDELSEFIIDVHDGFFEKEEVPEWCPLIKYSINIKLIDKKR